ncbi:MAG: hypothetical protein COV91_05975 [Candidatus Taylorbacteria bacterium CG11_big_fil_rev_8_21_14_0_20_46_11]|uniref:Polymer-forming cytoskeletal protein n=1 Tax=Candidatus Taylorbacteria bacterium CG11_big_fil_rev_8_21_14_0_20_46_11 TaxID=1975025 RepID=A0A2H0KCG6_9BACT|nr:MAG: hypothetical protein COV91_05975 [Candidatus Taylorbacteria bacterium CG11_big_fil_rev_8_21_14_0_20_46_11]
MIKWCFFLLAGLCMPFSASALVHVGGDYFLKGSEKVSDDVYVIGETSAITGTVNGDVTSLAPFIVSEGDISADVLLLGSQVTLGGTVGDDARLVGQTVILNGVVFDDVVAIGTKVVLSKGASIKGNLYIVGGNVSIEGEVLGDVRVFAQKATVSGTIGGTVESWGSFEIMKDATITGDLVYHADQELIVPDRTHIGGTIIFADTHSESILEANSTMFGGFFALYTLMVLTLSFFLFFFMRERTEEVLLEVLPRFGARLVRGILIVVVGPILIGILVGSVIGLPIALIALCLYVIMLIFGSAISAIIVGAAFERYALKRSVFPLSYRPVVIGTLALSLLGTLPFIGFLLHLILLCVSVGGIGTVVYHRVREFR